MMARPETTKGVCSPEGSDIDGGQQPSAEGARAPVQVRPSDRNDEPRIVHLVLRMAVGGLEYEIVNLARGLDRMGFAQAVCCLQDPGELADQLPASVPVWACAEEGRRPPRIPRLAAARIRDWNPDVVHVRNPPAWPDAVLARLLAGRPGRLAFSFHGWTQVEPIAPGRARLYRLLARLTGALAAISVEAADQFAAESGIPRGRFAVLSSGIDTERFRPASEPKSGGRVVLGCVARLDPIKAHDVLIEAFALAVAAGRDLELRLLGDGPRRADLEHLARERGVADRVRFLGMAGDVPEQLRELDFVVLASHREGRPLSIMEAMAAGLPMVATRVGSVPAMVADGETGLLIDPGDVEGLARAIGTLADDEPLRRRLGAEARAVALSELSLDRMIHQYATFYRELSRKA